MQATAPVLTLIAARIILKEQVRNLQKLFMAISVSGVVFINVMNGFNIGNYSYLGFLFILMSAVSFAIYNVLIKKISKNYSVFFNRLCYEYCRLYCFQLDFYHSTYFKW